jgi:hypothetical protein
VAHFAKQNLIPSQKKLLRLAAEKARLAAAETMKTVLLRQAESMLTNAGENPEPSVLQAVEALRAAADDSVRLLSPPPVCSIFHVLYLCIMDENFYFSIFFS